MPAKPLVHGFGDLGELQKGIGPVTRHCVKLQIAPEILSVQSRQWEAEAEACHAAALSRRWPSGEVRNAVEWPLLLRLRLCARCGEAVLPDAVHRLGRDASPLV